jgi:histidinol-phosphate phosphatase family protein
VTFDVVIPTAGRPSLQALLAALATGDGPSPRRVLVVDDRSERSLPLPLGEPRWPVHVAEGPGRGPAAARNAGWRSAGSDWVAFLDDDVLPLPGWRRALQHDLAAVGPRTAGSQGRLEVPLPRHRRPTDWERNTAGLQDARWATADMAFRRSALAAVGGFDERFRRAYREDAELAVRLLEAGFELARGARRTLHPVRPAGRWVSLRMQAGNADDALMHALHGRDWRRRAGAPRGRLPRHLAVTAATLGTGVALAARRPRAAAAALAGWAAGTAELAWARIAPGPRTRTEVLKMLATSVLMPPLATFQRGRGVARLPLRLSEPGPRPEPPAAVMFDRDGTLVEDVPYNGDPALVRAKPGAERALARLRSEGVGLAVVSNQSAVARGLLEAEQVDAVNERVEQLLGPIGAWFWCPHLPDSGCDCRKPAPGLVLRAAAALGVEPARCAVVGDIGADVQAARAAGARGVLVPTARTRREEIAAAPETAPDLESAVDLLMNRP